MYPSGPFLVTVHSLEKISLWVVSVMSSAAVYLIYSSNIRAAVRSDDQYEKFIQNAFS